MGSFILSEFLRKFLKIENETKQSKFLTGLFFAKQGQMFADDEFSKWYLIAIAREMCWERKTCFKTISLLLLQEKQLGSDASEAEDIRNNTSIYLKNKASDYSILLCLLCQHMTLVLLNYLFEQSMSSLNWQRKISFYKIFCVEQLQVRIFSKIKRKRKFSTTSSGICQDVLQLIVGKICTQQ